MEQKIIVSIISVIGALVTNYISVKLKSNSIRESGLKIKIKLNFFELNFKSKITKK